MEKTAFNFKLFVTDKFGIFLGRIWYILCKKSWQQWLEASFRVYCVLHEGCHQFICCAFHSNTGSPIRIYQ